MPAYDENDLNGAVFRSRGWPVDQRRREVSWRKEPGGKVGTEPTGPRATRAPAPWGGRGGQPTEQTTERWSYSRLLRCKRNKVLAVTAHPSNKPPTNLIVISCRPFAPPRTEPTAGSLLQSPA